MVSSPRFMSESGCAKSMKASDSSPAQHAFSLTSSTVTATATLSEASMSPATYLPAPSVEVKLFVGRLPKTCEAPQLRAIFADFGIVRDVVILRDRETAEHKGCAFVRMASITQADAAIRSLNHIKVLDPNLGAIQVKYASGERERLGLPIDSCQPGVDQAKLFVGSLPKTATEEDIRSVFSQFGTLDEVYIMRDENKNSKGCAFVRFAYKEEAFNAIAHLNGKRALRDGIRAMEVRFAETRRPTKTEEQQQQQPQSQKQQQQQQPIPCVLGRGLASVSRPPAPSAAEWYEYMSQEGRLYYYHVASGHTQWERPQDVDDVLHASRLYVSQQQPQQQQSQSGTTATTPDYPQQHQGGGGLVSPNSVGAQTHGPPGANVFIFHIPNAWTEHDLAVHFSPFGQLVSARIATDKGTNRRLGFGFVSFTSIESAVQAVATLNGFPVAGKRLKVTIKRGEEQYAATFLHNGVFPQSARRDDVVALRDFARSLPPPTTGRTPGGAGGGDHMTTTSTATPYHPFLRGSVSAASTLDITGPMDDMFTFDPVESPAIGGGLATMSQQLSHWTVPPPTMVQAMSPMRTSFKRTDHTAASAMIPALDASTLTTAYPVPATTNTPLFPRSQPIAPSAAAFSCALYGYPQGSTTMAH